MYRSSLLVLDSLFTFLSISTIFRKLNDNGNDELSLLLDVDSFLIHRYKTELIPPLPTLQLLFCILVTRSLCNCFAFYIKHFGSYSMETVSPLNFGLRQCASKIEFMQKDDSIYVSAIGPTLFTVPVSDVDYAEKNMLDYTIRRNNFRIFSKGTGIDIKGISKFSDADIFIVFSSRFLAFLGGEELREIHKMEKGTERSHVVCSKQVVEIPDNLEIVDLQCLEARELLVVCRTKLVSAMIRSRGERYVIEVRDYVTSIRGLIKASCFVKSPNGDHNWMLVLVANDGTWFIEFLPDCKVAEQQIYKANATASCHVQANGTIRILAEKSIGSLSMEEFARSELPRSVTERIPTSRRLFKIRDLTSNSTPENWPLRRDFIAAMETDCLLLSKGSICRISVDKTCYRHDLLCSADPTNVDPDVEKKRLIATACDSSWICIQFEEGDLMSYPDCCNFGRETTYSLINCYDSVVKLASNGCYHTHSFLPGGHVDRIIEGNVERQALVECSNGPIEKDLVITNVRQSLRTSTVQRAILFTDKGLLACDFKTKTVLSQLTSAIGTAVWATPLGKETLLMSRSGMMSVLDDELQSVFQCDPIVRTRNAQELSRKLIVRRWTLSGNAHVLLFGYENELKWSFYEVSNETPGFSDENNIVQTQGIHPCELSLIGKEDSIHVADMLLETGGLLTLLLRNGTIVNYRLEMNMAKKCCLFEFISSRRVDIIGMQLFRTSQGIRVFGLVNNYELPSTNRICADDMTEIDKFYSLKESPYAHALVDPYSGYVLSQFEHPNVDNDKLAYVVEKNIVNVMFVDSDSNSDLNVYSLDTMSPISLTQIIRPPGVYKGMVSSAIDNRFSIIAASFLNIHIYVLDTVNGRLTEVGAYGWERDLSVLTMTEVVNGHLYLLAHAGSIFSLIDIRLIAVPGSYDVAVKPVQRFVAVKPVHVEQGQLDHTIFGGGLSSLTYATAEESPVRFNTIVQVTKKNSEESVDYIGVSSDGFGNICNVQLQLPKTEFPRQFIQVQPEQPMFIAEGCVTGIIFICGNHRIEEILKTPLHTLSQLSIHRIENSSDTIVCAAASERDGSTWLFLLKVKSDNTMEWYKPPIRILFDETIAPARRALPVKLFLYISITCHIYVYRLIRTTNFLSVVEINCLPDPPERETSLLVEKLPHIFLECEGIQDLDSSDIHFVNSEFLFTNDGPRMIRVHKCV